MWVNRTPAPQSLGHYTHRHIVGKQTNIQTQKKKPLFALGCTLLQMQAQSSCSHYNAANSWIQSFCINSQRLCFRNIILSLNEYNASSASFLIVYLDFNDGKKVIACMMEAESLQMYSVLPDMELSCFFDEDDLLSCLKEFSSSASPSPHQDGWPYRGVPRGSAATSPVTDAHTNIFKFLYSAEGAHFSVAQVCQVLLRCLNSSLNHGAAKWTELVVVYECLRINSLANSLSTELFSDLSFSLLHPLRHKQCI